MTKRLIVALVLLAVGLGAGKGPLGDMFTRTPLVDVFKQEREARTRQLITERAQRRAAYRRSQMAHWEPKPVFYIRGPASWSSGGREFEYIPGFGTWDVTPFTLTGR